MGGGIGTILASIEIPILLNALTGKGLHVDGNRPARSMNFYEPGSSGGAHGGPMMPPPVLSSRDQGRLLRVSLNHGIKTRKQTSSKCKLNLR